ncbi:MAG: YadA-like family protein [Pyramidobacter sp.]|nr:YadA-like family protein [Pyramidobacter sp.]
MRRLHTDDPRSAARHLFATQAARILSAFLIGACLAGGCGLRAAWGASATKASVNVTEGSSGNASSAWGVGTTADTEGSTAWGYSTRSGSGNVNGAAVGGDYTTAWGIGSQALGTGATAWGGYIIGTENHPGGAAVGLGATAFGSGTWAEGSLSTAWGSGTSAKGENSTAWGYQTQASAAQATVWGANTAASAAHATAWGSSTAANGEGATVWGLGSTVSGDYATAFGNTSNAAGNNSLAALGGTTGDDAANSAAIGNGATVTVADTVALGSGSVADREAGDANAYLKGSNTGSAWVSTHNAIAVGHADTSNDSKSVTRQITGVAAGTEDTDAVNVAQLKAAVQSSPSYTAGDGITITGTDAKTLSVNAGDDFSFDSDHKLQLKKDGKVEANNRGVVTGDTVYQALKGKADKATTLAGYGITDGATKSELEAITSDVSGLKTRVSANEGSIDKLNTRMTTAESDLKAITGNVSGLEARVSANEGSIDALDTRMGNSESRIAEHAKSIGTLDGRLTTAESDLKSVVGDVSGLKTRVSSNETSINALDTRMGNLESHIAEHAKSIGTLDGRLMTAESDLRAVVGDVSGLKTKVSENAAAIVLNTKAISKHEQALTKLDQNLNSDKVSIGKGSSATGRRSIAVGYRNQVTGDYSGALGDPNSLSGTGSYAIGNDNTIGGNNTFVFGSGVKANVDNAVVLGNKSEAVAGAVSVGAPGKERQIKNVAAGKVEKNSTDAVNGGQLWDLEQKINTGSGAGLQELDRKLTRDIREVGSRAAALAGLHPLPYDEDAPTTFNVAVGSYRGETSAAVGMSHHFTRDAMFSVGGTVGSRPMFNAGFALRLGRYDEKVVEARKRRRKETAEKNRLLGQMSAQNAQIDRQAAELAQVKRERDRDRMELEALRRRLDLLEQRLSQPAQSSRRRRNK